MTTRQSLLSLLLLAALLGAISGRYVTLHRPEPVVLAGVFELVSSFVLFNWYYSDSNARDYLRSRWLNVAVILLGWLAIPYYLVRSRPRGKKLRALVKCLGFAVLSGAVAMLGIGVGAAL